MKAVLAAVVACGCLAFAGAARAEHYEVFLLAGQSNMDGRGKVADLTGPLGSWAGQQKDVLITYAQGGLHRTYLASQGWHPLEAGYSVNTSGKTTAFPGSSFGPEVSFGRDLATGLPGKKVALLKFAEGGTSLKKDWNPADKGKLYEKFLDFARARLKVLTDRGDTYELRGMAWHQGESDASLPAGEYQKLLTEFIARVRADLGVKDLPFVIGEVYDNGKRDKVRQAQKATAQAVARAGFVSAKDLKTFDKGTHFDAASQIELGKRMAAEMLRLLATDKGR